MNKKVLTLCAGFLLAGGMLSSLSAEKLTVVADNGKYYKMEEGAYITEGTSWTKDKTGTWFLDLNQSKEATLANKSVANDYWKVVTVENGYKLVNLKRISELQATISANDLEKVICTYPYKYNCYDLCVFVPPFPCGDCITEQFFDTGLFKI